ncbi:tetratricopeptide repeat protein [Streptomyces sp. NBC_00190]|uniref:tetratricopeptide repeat protein n=1 Tax=unclassified Streptomyces TaxID=2593676 RepID=UPI002E2E18A9|nr:tetratricopeptide repeat protein [Streptomyces sp. NBC_00190]WSZ38166.1 tetratricopeptide repeat protein [Streptomyces sp. NBC_00868]
MQASPPARRGLAVGALTARAHGVRRADRVLGADHPDTLDSCNNLAVAYKSAGDLVRAVPLYERTLEDCERVLSPGHPATALVRVNLEQARSTQCFGVYWPSARG